jgi:phenylpropionate dioxygenase-like ring-hydroxylating dioxygenase large terminal subunit
MSKQLLGINPWMIAGVGRNLRRQRVVSGHADNLPLALFRDADGGVRALEDRCAHRNAPLSLGRINEGRLQCAYHGWTYDADGLLLNVPALAQGAAPSACSVRRYHALEQDGFVWVALGDALPSVLPPRFPHFGERGWTSFVMKTGFEASIDACLENFLDCPHATFLHRYWFRSPTARRVKATVCTLPDGAQVEFREEPREKSLVWWLLAPRRAKMRHTDRFIAPRTSQVNYEFANGATYIITSSCTAVSATETTVYTVISFRYGRIAPLLRLLFEPLARRIIRQDVKMLQAQTRNVARFGGPRFASTRADLLGGYISAWRRGLERGDPLPAAGVTSDVDIRL